MYLKENIEMIFSNLENIIKAKIVIGEPVIINEDVTLVPVVNVSFGIGAGGGEVGNKDIADKGVLGAGTGANLTPSAVIVVKKDQVSLLPIVKKGNLDQVVELLPELLKKLDLDCETSDSDAGTEEDTDFDADHDKDENQDEDDI